MCTTCGTLAGCRIFWRRGETQCWGFYNNGEGDTHMATLQFLLSYLEPFPQTPPWSRVGSCVLPGASSPHQRRNTFPYSACPPEAAPGLISGLWEREGESMASVNTHLLPMQTWSSRQRLNHYLDSFHTAASKTSLFSSFFCFLSLLLHSYFFIPHQLCIHSGLRNSAWIICICKMINWDR